MGPLPSLEASVLFLFLKCFYCGKINNVKAAIFNLCDSAALMTLTGCTVIATVHFQNLFVIPTHCPLSRSPAPPSPASVTAGAELPCQCTSPALVLSRTCGFLV